MTATRRTYEPKRDFIRVRNFLAQTYNAFPSPFNWGIERWNYARYFVAPMLGSNGNDHGIPEGSLKAIALWEDLIGLWENERGDIVGVTCIEHPHPDHSGFGEAFIQRHPDHADLLEDMIAYAEERYVDPKKNRVYTWAYDNDRDLICVLTERGYERRDEPTSHSMKCTFGEIPALELPEGFRLMSMAEVNDIDKRREIFGRGFNHEDPHDWPSAFSYKELQRAPDYRKEHDLFIVAPDGTYAACCIVWFNEIDRVGYLEPLSTHPDFRRMGLGRQILNEGMRRLKALGATYMPMDDGFDPFYLAVGFEVQQTRRPWIKHF